MGLLQHWSGMGAGMMGQDGVDQVIPLPLVGSNKFGRTNKMSSEQTVNMIISDGWFVPFGGYYPKVQGSLTSVGRAIFSSQVLQRLFCVINNKVFYVGVGGDVEFVGLLQTSSGDVFIEENNAGQIAFSDKKNIYVLEVGPPITFTTLTFADLGFVPGNLTFQNGRFITVDLSTNQWRLSALPPDGALSWPDDAQHVGAIETKPGNARGVLRFPGSGNKLLVYGENVAEIWQDVGAALFPYQRDQSTNLDYGLANTATLAGNQNMVCWVGSNEQSGPAIMFTLGNKVQTISTDGIDEKIATFKFPEECFAFMVRLIGHVCYVITWPKDNTTYLYDFDTKSFFTLCDENMDEFIAKQVAFFNNKYWFVSINDGSVYELNANFPAYDYGNGKSFEIPLVRVLPAITLENQSAFVARNPAFEIEQGGFVYQVGDTNNIPRVDMSISVDGGVNYSSDWAQDMNPIGSRISQFQWNDSLGRANDLTLQFRFHGFTGKFVPKNGTIGVWQ